jgi:Arc/MetJ-type ribon-helix-helix transcriptional regulator
MRILLNPDLEQRIVAKVESGHYRSPAEVIEEGLDLLDSRDATQHDAGNHDETPIWETVVRIGQEVPEREWSALPTDLSKNLDHYLYGSPKVSE